LPAATAAAAAAAAVDAGQHQLGLAGGAGV
jgi:hypothetical protein